MTKLLSFAFALTLALPAYAADSQPEEFLRAWESLRAAVLARRVEEASALAHFPLRSIDSGHKDVESATALKDRFPAIFEAKLVELIKHGQCETGKGEPGYEANCGNGYMIFGFEQEGKQYRLFYFGSINE